MSVKNEAGSVPGPRPDSVAGELVMERIYVGDLGQGVTDQHLARYFSQFGQVGPFFIR